MPTLFEFLWLEEKEATFGMMKTFLSNLLVRTWMSGSTCNPLKKSPSFSKFSRSGTVRRVKMSVGVNYQEGASINTYLHFLFSRRGNHGM